MENTEDTEGHGVSHGMLFVFGLRSSVFDLHPLYLSHFHISFQEVFFPYIRIPVL